MVGGSEEEENGVCFTAIRRDLSYENSLFIMEIINLFAFDDDGNAVHCD